MKSELVNCDFCGRDTRNKSRICSHCMGGVSKHTQRQTPEPKVDEAQTREEEIEQNVLEMLQEATG